MSQRSSVSIALAALVLASSTPLAAGTFLLTADGEGHVGPCRTCPLSSGLGGLARRATLVAGLRREDPAALLVDAGNWLFGAESLESGGKILVSAYDALAYDAANLSWRDFRLGKDATLALLKEARLAVVSASVLDEETGRPLVAPYVVKNSAAGRVAILGITDVPAGLDFLPHLRTQLAGLRLRPPLEALAEWLPKARAEADRAVLLYYGSAGTLEAIRERFTGQLSAVLAGGMESSSPPAEQGTPVARVKGHGEYLARCLLRGAGAEARLEVAELPVEASLAEDPGVVKVLDPHRKPALAPPAESTAESALPAGIPAALTAGKTERLELAGESRGVRVSVSTAYLEEDPAAAAGAAGRRSLVLATTWENIIPLTLIEERQVPTTYKIPVLADHLYLVVNDSLLARLRPDAQDLPGHVPVRDFTLPQIGSRIEGNLVFDLPAAPLAALELRFYDFAHGHVTLPLLEPPSPAAPEAAKPLGEPRRNEVLEAGIYRVERRKRLGDQTAPAGLDFLVMEIRARSLFTMDADGSAFDPQARPGARLKIGTVADWKEARTHLQLVADGEYGYAPREESSLPAEPRFLPDLMTGGELVFLAPQDARSLALRCDFPNARGPDGKVFHPAGFVLPIEGTPPPLAERPPIASIQDDVYQVAVAGQEAALEFAGVKAEEGQAFLVLAITVRNTGKKGEFFQTLEQLKHAAEDGKQTAIDPVTFQGLHHPAPLLWIPAGERRTFDVVFRISAAEKRPRLAFTGVSLARVLDLQPREGPPAARAGESGTRDAGEAAVASTAAPAAGTKAKEPAPPPATSAQPAASGASAAGPRSGSPAAVAAKLPKRVAARQPATPRGLAGVGLTAEEVNRAIARGSEFLWQNLQEDLKKSRRPLGSRAGHDILPAFALVHSEAHRRFPEFDAALRTFLTRIDPVRDLSAATYDIGLLCMLIEAYDDPSLWPQLKRGARYLLETQGPEGSWGYGRRPPPECFGDPVRDDRVLEVQGGHPLDGAGDKPWERRCKLDPNTDGDNSTSQYALLGLHAASRAGAKVEPETWRRVLAASGQRQNADGGWAYRTGGPSYGSMTCAGVCARAIARHQLGEQDPGADEVLERGLGWLNANFTVTRNPPNQQWLYYYLYSLERVGRILDTEFIGEHEWYPVGARHLLAQQKADGSWLGTGTEAHPPVATSFALLFLTRATPTLASEPKRGGDGVLKTRIAYPPGNKYYVILDASGSMLAEMEGRKKFDIAREALAELVKALPDSAQVALRVYGHRKLATEQGASEDTALELSMRPLARADFLAKLEALRARGKTPLARSLLEAKRDLAGAREDAPVTVVFLTDGGEDTMPRQDPIQAAEEFGKLRGIVLHVIGFDIHREDWRGQLEEMTRRAGGRFWPARQAAALGQELQAAVFGVPAAYVVLDGAGREAAKGAFGGTQTLKEGKYTFTTAYAGTEFREEFWVNTGSTTSVTFHAAKVPSGKSGPAKTTPVAAPAAPAAAPAESQSAPAAKKFCTGCGKPVEPKHKFCVSCGARTGN